MQVASYDDAALAGQAGLAASASPAPAPGQMTAEELARSMLDGASRDMEESFEKLADSLVKTVNALSSSLRLSQHAGGEGEVAASGAISSTAGAADTAAAVSKQLDNSVELGEGAEPAAAPVSI